MEKQIIKIDSKGKVIRLIPKKDGEMNKAIFEMSDFFSMWLTSICEEGKVRDFHFESPDSVHIDYLSCGDFYAYACEIKLILDESALANEKFMAQLRYMEETFSMDKEIWQRNFDNNLKNENRRVAAATACFDILKRLCNGESLEDIGKVENPHLVLSYFYSHKKTFESYSQKILTPKQNKWSNFFSRGTMISMIVCIVSFFSTLMLLCFESSLRLFVLISGGTLLSSFLSTLLFSIFESFDKEKVETVYPKFIESFEDALIMGNTMTKKEELEYILESTKEYIAMSAIDFQSELEALDALLANLTEEKGDEFDEFERIKDIKRLLEIEWHIYSKEERFGSKDETPYTFERIMDILDYIGLDEEELADEVLTALEDTCVDVLGNPFYGCELEATRLLQAIVNYTEEMYRYDTHEEFVQSANYDVAIEGYHTLIAEVKAARERALKSAELQSVEKELVACRETKEIPQAIFSQGTAMQMMPKKADE